jgi:hypothetical protein
MTRRSRVLLRARGRLGSWHLASQIGVSAKTRQIMRRMQHSALNVALGFRTTE